MKQVASVPAVGLLLVLGALCASGGCADFTQEQAAYCNRNPQICAQESGAARTVVEVAAGGYFTLARLSDNSVLSFGWNDHGELGDGSTTSHFMPQPVSGLSGVAHVAAGINHALALVGGGVWYWGLLPSGELQTRPAQVSGLDGITEISAGDSYSLSLDSSGSVWAWGTSAVQSSPAPVKIQGLPTIMHITAGDAHALALDVDGGVWAWGSNATGQLGNSGPTTTTPSKVEGLPRITSIAAGSNNSLALDATGAVWAWGGNSSGELGDGTTTGRFTPTKVPDLVNIQSVAAGGQHVVVIDAKGAVICWGRNVSGELGDGNANPSSLTPVKTVSLPSASKVSAGLYHSMAIVTSGDLWTWGENGHGQLGNTDPTADARVLRPALVSIP